MLSRRTQRRAAPSDRGQGPTTGFSYNAGAPGCSSGLRFENCSSKWHLSALGCAKPAVPRFRAAPLLSLRVEAQGALRLPRPRPRCLRPGHEAVLLAARRRWSPPTMSFGKASGNGASGGTDVAGPIGAASRSNNASAKPSPSHSASCLAYSDALRPLGGNRFARRSTL